MKIFSAKIKFLLLNLAVAIILVWIIGYYVLSRLDSYTQHGYFISVPAFYDLTPEEAVNTATRQGLRVQIIDSLYDETAKPGTILEQSPAAGSHVKENRLIYLTTNARNPEKIVFPNLQNSAYRQTIQTLESRGFKIGRIEYAPSEFKNLVLDLKHNENPVSPGSLITKGATINIVLGSGNGSNNIVMPQLLGKKIREAMDILRKNYLNIGEIVPDASISNKNETYSAVIYKQEPNPDETIEAGSFVKLYITLEKSKIAVLDSLMVTE